MIDEVNTDTRTLVTFIPRPHTHPLTVSPTPTRELRDHFVVTKTKLFDNSFDARCEKLILLDVFHSELEVLQNDINKSRIQ